MHTQVRKLANSLAIVRKGIVSRVTDRFSQIMNGLKVLFALHRTDILVESLLGNYFSYEAYAIEVLKIPQLQSWKGPLLLLSLLGNVKYSTQLRSKITLRIIHDLYGSVSHPLLVFLSLCVKTACAQAFKLASIHAKSFLRTDRKTKLPTHKELRFLPKMNLPLKSWVSE